MSKSIETTCRVKTVTIKAGGTELLLNSMSLSAQDYKRLEKLAVSQDTTTLSLNLPDED